MLWTNFKPISDSSPIGFDSGHWSALQDLAKRVRQRTNARAWLDMWRDQICFGYQDPDGYISIVLDFKVYRSEFPSRNHPDYFRDHQAINCDSICRLIFLARVDPLLKAKWRAESEKLQKQEDEARKASYLDGMDGEIKHRLKFNMGQTVITG